MKDIRLLLTGNGAPGSPSIIKCLRRVKERNIYIVGVDMNEQSPGRRLVDKFYKVPSANDPNFIDCILQICEKENIDVVTSIVTKELEVFANNSDKFKSANVLLSMMDKESLRIVNNKGNLFNSMQELGIITPNYTIAHNSEEVRKGIYKMGYPHEPVVVKPTFGNGSRGTRVLDSSVSKYDNFFKSKPNSYLISLEDLMDTLSEKPNIPEMMVMEYLPGSEYSVDILAENGNVVYSVCRKGLNVVSSNMIDSITEKNAIIEKLCCEVVKGLRLSGNVGFDLKERSDGTPLIMEINPRLTAGVVVAAVAGINFPYLRIKQLLGERLPNLNAKEGIIMQRRYQEVFFDSSGVELEW